MSKFWQLTVLTVLATCLGAGCGPEPDDTMSEPHRFGTCAPFTTPTPEQFCGTFVSGTFAPDTSFEDYECVSMPGAGGCIDPGFQVYYSAMPCGQDSRCR